jgi:hypothetical protein
MEAMEGFRSKGDALAEDFATMSDSGGNRMETVEA